MALGSLKSRTLKHRNPHGRGRLFPGSKVVRRLCFAIPSGARESIALDLKSEAGKAALAELIKSADVLVEAFRPGVAGRLGFGPEAVKAINPRIVYCSISAFGQSGPWRDKPAHDTATVAASGGTEPVTLS